MSSHSIPRRTILKGLGATAVVLGCQRREALGEAEPPPYLSAGELLERYRQRGFTPREYCSALAALIDKVDPLLASVVEVNPQLEAELLRIEDLQGAPLWGLPVLLKDNIASANDMVNSAGSAALLASRPGFDAAIVSRLRANGAVLFGKTNMSEWANFRSPHASSGWSARGGQTRNPHALDRTPCGSSSGAAAAVAAGFAPLSVGTETVGSIICPSAVCGIVGFKPSAPLLSGDGIIPIAPSWETAGPMTRTVSDAALLLAGMRDTYSAIELKKGALRGARIGVARELFGFDAKVDQLIETSLEALRELGAELVDPVELPSWSTISADVQQVMLYEFKAGVDAYLARLGPSAPVHTLEEVIEFNQRCAIVEELARYGQDLLLRAQATEGLEAPEYRAALKRLRASLESDGLEQVFESQSLDAVVSPSNGPAWLIDPINGDHFKGGSSALPAVAGCPHLTVPAGFVKQLPVGLSLYGPKGTDERILALGYDFEQHTQKLRPPRYLESVHR